MNVTVKFIALDILMEINTNNWVFAKQFRMSSALFTNSHMNFPTYPTI